MTIEQALEIKQKWTSEQARNDLERLLLRGEKPADKVVALACKALEKQIPKKVIFGDDEQDSICCPNCKGELLSMDWYDHWKCNYCEFCGQALDWSEEKR